MNNVDLVLHIKHVVVVTNVIVKSLAFNVLLNPDTLELDIKMGFKNGRCEGKRKI